MNTSKLSPVKHSLAHLVAAVGDLKKPGIFVLYKTNMGTPSWVSRADASLFEGLMAFRNHPTYKYYKIMPCRSREESYLWECIYWHSGAETLDNGAAKNGRHPRRPKGTEVGCPFPGCTYVHEEVESIEVHSAGAGF